MGWPCFWNDFNLAIKLSPTKSTKAKEVATDIPVLKVIYLKTLKALISEEKYLKKNIALLKFLKKIKQTNSIWWFD